MNPLIFYAATVGFAYLDLLIFALIEQPLIFTTIGFYCLTLLHNPKPLRLAAVALAACVTFSIYFSWFGIPLIFLIPASVFGLQVSHWLHSRWLHYSILITLCMLIQGCIIEPFVLQLPFSGVYTFYKIIANIIVIMGISLIYPRR